MKAILFVVMVLLVTSEGDSFRCWLACPC